MKTILVVDDEETILLVISRFLSNLSTRFKILTAENGAEAIDVLRATKVDLVLTDLNMPVMDGFTLLAYISDNHPYIQTIAMTAVQSREVTEKLDFLGIRSIFQKPFDLNFLKEAILHLLGWDAGKPEPAYSAQKNHALKSALIKGVFLP